MKIKKNNNFSDEKVDKKKTIVSLVIMFLLIISSSFFFQSCDASIINEEDSDLIDQFISDIENENDEEFLNEENKDEEDSSEEMLYFILDFVDEINKNYSNWVIESYDTKLVPTSFSIYEFYEDRMYGWADLGGFEDDINNGFCYFEVNQNVMLFLSDDNSFIASINFNQCWQENDKIYSKLIVNDQEVLCYCII